MIAIVDYGVGNVRSVERALLHVGAQPKLTADPDDLRTLARDHPSVRVESIK